MDIGRLDRRVTLQRPERTTGGDGSWVETWVDVATVWATVTLVGARERTAAPQVLPELTARIHIRHRADVLPSWRVLYEGKAWAIGGVSELGRREGLELFVTAVGTS